VLSEPTSDITQVYSIGKKVGEGGYGTCHLCTHLETNEVRAVKIVPKKNLTAEQCSGLREEYEFMADLDHPNIIKAFDAFESKQSFYIVMEYCAGGELFERIREKKRYSERDAALVIKQILTGIKYLHEHNIAHCDLKPDNFLFLSKEDDSPVKIIDFGFSKRTARRAMLSRKIGTMFYMAPEVLQENYTFHCDMWSIGIILFVMMFGYPPFCGNDNATITRKILAGFNPVVKNGFGSWFPASVPVSSNVKYIMRCLMHQDPSERLTAGEVLELPWIAHAHENSSQELTGILGNLAAFTAQYRFKNVVLRALSTSLDDEEFTSMRRTFSDLNSSGDGSLTSDELVAALGRASSSDEKASIQSLLDFGMINGGSISYQQLVMVFLAKKLATKEERMHNVFTALDLDGDGKLSASEISACLSDFIESGDAVEDLIEEVDLNGDGYIDFDEFAAMFVGKTDSAKNLNPAKDSSSSAPSKETSE
jgi:calcium-dependent protein kinase